MHIGNEHSSSPEHRYVLETCWTSPNVSCIETKQTDTLEEANVEKQSDCNNF
jgi:hypothetical protein